MITNDKQIDLCIEQICEQGCRYVNQVIEQLEKNKIMDRLNHLNFVQQKILLRELKSIMAVYADTGSCEVRAIDNR
jgi:hypothetical protein